MGRRTVQGKSWDDVYSYVAAVLDALGLAAEDGDKEVGALTRKVEPLIVRWEALDVERRAKLRAIGRANALVRRRDNGADRATDELHIDTLAEVRQKREHPVYEHLFPDGVTAETKPALEGQLPLMRALVRRVGDKETPATIRKAHLEPLKKALSLGEAAVTAREDAYAESGRTTARTVSLREDADRVLMGVEGALTTIASERDLDEAWVDSFFPVAEAAPKKKKPASPDAPPTK